jgi:magnesium chelatase accessory protein
MRWPPPADWPHAEHSRQVLCKPHRWHVQEMGTGDTLLLIHGTGGSTHSFRGLMPLLAQDFHVVAVDLPGQGFTQLGARHRCGLDATTEDLAALCDQEGWAPRVLVGHSAGAAIALNLCAKILSARAQKPYVIGINPALQNFEGVAGALFPALAKLLANVPFTAKLFAAGNASPERAQALILSTGSKLDAVSLGLYRHLISDRDHVDATLLMMAQWRLDGLVRALPGIDNRVLFITGENDRTVPPRVAQAAAARMPHTEVQSLAEVGHLAHEERADEVATVIRDWLEACRS